MSRLLQQVPGLARRLSIARPPAVNGTRSFSASAGHGTEEEALGEALLLARKGRFTGFHTASVAVVDGDCQTVAAKVENTACMLQTSIISP